MMMMKMMMLMMMMVMIFIHIHIIIIIAEDSDLAESGSCIVALLRSMPTEFPLSFFLWEQSPQREE